MRLADRRLYDLHAITHPLAHAVSTRSEEEKIEIRKISNFTLEEVSEMERQSFALRDDGEI